MSLKTNWNKVCSRYAQSKFNFYLTPSHYCLKTVLNYIKKHAKGECLDLGAGHLTYKRFLEKVVDKYTSLDKFATNKEIDIIADAQQLPFENNRFDTIFCSQVLEHIEQPNRVFSEISRCLKPGSRLILSVPHLQYLHGEPFDFYRFTPYSLDFFCKANNLRQIEVKPIGSILGFALTPVSIASLSISANIPLINKLTLYLNSMFSFSIGTLDRIFNLKAYAINYIIVAEKDENISHKL